MAAEEASLLREAYREFNRAVRAGDLASWIERFIHPAVEWRLGADFPDVETFRGHAGVRRLFDRWLDAWEEWTLEPEEFIEADGTWVVLDRIRGRGKESGVDVDIPYAHLFRLSDGKVIEVQDHPAREEALAAAGVKRRQRPQER